MWRRSIRARMALGFVLAFLPLLVLACVAVVVVSGRAAEAAQSRRLQAAADRAAKILSLQSWRAAVPVLITDSSVMNAGTSTAPIGILELDGAGHILGQIGRVPRLPWPELVLHPAKLEAMIKGSQPPGFGPPIGAGSIRFHAPLWVSPAARPGPPPRGMPARMEPPPGEPWLTAPGWQFALSRLWDGRIIIAAIPRRATMAAPRQRAWNLLETGVAGLLVLAASAWFLVGRVLSPIQRLADQAHEATGQDLLVQLEAPSRDTEVVHLVGTLNGLLARQAQAAAVRGRFYAAASHELRTPLQALSGHLEVALSRERSAPEYRETLAEAYRQTQRLSRLTTDLLLLNRLESAAPEQKETVDLRDAVDEVLRQYQTEIRRRQLQVTEKMDHAVTLQAPPTHVAILVRNLLENAVKYTEPGGHLRVALFPGPNPRLEATNQAAWDPVADGARLLEPFYRPDPSRNSRTGGNGLGLAICRAIVQANGWRMDLDRAADGVRATVEFDPPVGAFDPHLAGVAQVETYER